MVLQWTFGFYKACVMSHTMRYLLWKPRVTTTLVSIPGRRVTKRLAARMQHKEAGKVINLLLVDNNSALRWARAGVHSSRYYLLDKVAMYCREYMLVDTAGCNKNTCLCCKKRYNQEHSSPSQDFRLPSCGCSLLSRRASFFRAHCMDEVFGSDSPKPVRNCRLINFRSLRYS